MVGAVRVDEAQEDGGANRGPRLAEGRRNAVAGGARLGREDLGGDLFDGGRNGVVCWSVKGSGQDLDPTMKRARAAL